MELNAELKYKKIILWLGCVILTLCLVASISFGMLYSFMTEENTNLLKTLQSTESMLNSRLSETKEELKDVMAQKDSISSEALQTGAEYNKKIGALNSQINSLTQEINKLKKNTNSINVVQLGSLNLYSATNAGDKICYLTFDDGPSENTLKILDILNKGNAKATFFVIGTRKLSYVKNIKAAGHSVGLHTDTHVFHKIYANDSAYFTDLLSIQAKVKLQIGENSTLLRFPGGSSNAVSKKYNNGIMTRLVPAVKNRGFQYFDWNVDSGDAAGNHIPAATIVGNVQKQVAGRKNICILMHDTDAKNTTVQALPYIISYLRGQGYRFEGLTKGSEGFHHHINN